MKSKPLKTLDMNKRIKYPLILLLLSIPLIWNCTSYQKEIEVSIQSENFDWVVLDQGIYAAIHKFGGRAICNVGVVDNGTETIIFDSFLDPYVTEELIQTVKTQGLSPIKYVVNSHSHNDHIRGNQVFSEDIQIISTQRNVELINEWEPKDIAEEKKYAPLRYAYYDSLYQEFHGDTLSREYKKILMWRPYYAILSESHEVIKTRLPDRFIEDSLTIDGPNHHVKILTRGGGHTESDLIMYIPGSKILFTGDLVFNECHPYLAHGNLTELRRYLKYLLDLEPHIVIPGHGKNSDQEIIKIMDQYVAEVQELATEWKKEDKESRMDPIELIPEEYKNWWFDRFFPVNLEFASKEEE